MTCEINGHKIRYTERDRFLVEIGRGAKGRYKVRNACSSPTQAVLMYDCINIGLGYKKRLRIRTTILARDRS